MARQYHTWFDWDKTNANQLFALFGQEFKAKIMPHVAESEPLKNSIGAFLEIGNERNKLVHQDYAIFALGKTLEGKRSINYTLPSFP